MGRARVPLRNGDVVVLTGQAAWEFRTRPRYARVIGVDSRDCGVGWVWLDCFVLAAPTWAAQERRKVLVSLAGVRVVSSTN